jgi:serine/threonine protein kinase
MSRATKFYEINTCLVVGDASLVYKATELASGRTVALELLLPGEQISHPLDAEALLRDAPGISRIAGVNIVQLLDAFRDDDGPVLVYEFADGTRGLDVPARCTIAGQIDRKVMKQHDQP